MIWKSYLIFIAHVLKEGKLLHYYVVIGQDKKNIHIADPDPSVKMTRLPRERFASEWTGVTIFIAPTSEYKPHKEKKNGLLDFVSLLAKQRGLIACLMICTSQINCLTRLLKRLRSSNLPQGNSWQIL